MEDDSYDRRVVKDMFNAAGVTTVEAESAERRLDILDDASITASVQKQNGIAVSSD